MTPTLIANTSCLDGALRPGTEVVVLNGVNYVLELGDWTVESVEELISSAHDSCDDQCSRIGFYARALYGTPFVFESHLPILAPQHVRVRLASLDCITFIYTVLALGHAADFNQLASNLSLIRYRDFESRGAWNEPEGGNIFDFASEALINNAQQRGFLLDSTAEIFGRDNLVSVTAHLQPQRRALAFDNEERLACPKYFCGPQTIEVLPREKFGLISKDVLLTGDIVLLTRAPLRADSVLVDHAVVAWVTPDGVFFIHATRNFAWRPDANGNSQRNHTGIYYDDDPRKEQLGVTFGLRHAGDELMFMREGLDYHGYFHNQLRSLADYASANFNGILILRAIERQ